MEIGHLRWTPGGLDSTLRICEDEEIPEGESSEDVSWLNMTTVLTKAISYCCTVSTSTSTVNARSNDHPPTNEVQGDASHDAVVLPLHERRRKMGSVANDLATFSGR